MIRAAFDRIFNVPDGPDESDRAASIRRKREDSIRSILAGETCMQRDTAGTAWALFNGITEWVDHERGTRGGESADAQRFASSVWGSGAALKQRAWETMLDLAR